MSSIKTLARAYAQGAFDYAKAHGKEAQWLELLENLNFISEHPEIQILSRNPTCDPQAFIEVLAKLLKLSATAPFLNFIRIIVKNRRFAWVSAILEQFKTLKDQDANILSVSVKSAVPLSPDASRTLLEKLEKKTGKKLEVTYSDDPGLLGGCVIEYGDTVIDLSLRYQIANLATHLTRV